MKIFLILLILLGSTSASAIAASPSLIVILLPGTSLNEWQRANAPNLHRLMQDGALAVMNTRIAHQAGQTGQETSQAALLTLGAGSRAAGAVVWKEFFPSISKAKEIGISSAALFERRTGLMPRADQSVCPDWPSVVHSNRSPGYDLRLGNLSDTLTTHGVSIVSGGGTDSDWIAVNSNGIVTRVPKLIVAPDQCLIWDAGTNVAAADAAIGEAAKQHSRLIVLSPYASNSNYQRNERLTPILVYGPGIAPGMLTSASTRRTGLVTNTDFAPSIAGYFGIQRAQFRSLPFGFAWSRSTSPNNIRDVERLNTQSIQQSQGMRILPYLAVALGIWILAVTLFAWQRQVVAFWTLVPLASLVAVLFAVSAWSFLALLPCIFILTLILMRLLRCERILAVLMTGIVIALIVDMITGNHLMHSGLLGYSAIEGARYYGIGNEAMGLLIGSGLVAASLLWTASKYGRLLILFLLFGIVCLLGSAGAKAGGVLVSLAVYGVYIYTGYGGRWTVRTIAVLAATVAAGMTIAALGDMYLLPARHSHIGEAVQRIMTGGLSEALDIIRRKFAVEGRLAYHSAWAVLLWIGLVCIGFLWKHVPAEAQTDRALRLAGIVGIIACLVLNDAGVVAAAIFSVLIWSSTAHKQKFPAPDCSGTGNSE